MSRCDSRYLGSTRYSDQKASGISTGDRLGSKTYNPRPTHPKSTGRYPLWDGISLDCPVEQIASFLLGILLREISIVFPDSDRDHPARLVLLLSKQGHPFRSMEIRWDAWEYIYVPMLKSLLLSKKLWSRNATDLKIVEAQVSAAFSQESG